MFAMRAVSNDDGINLVRGRPRPDQPIYVGSGDYPEGQNSFRAADG
jgi:hypothetical protein